MGDPPFTFDDLLGSAPRSIGRSAGIAKLNERIAWLKAERAKVLGLLPGHVSKLDHQISWAERRLKKLMFAAARK